MNINELKPYAKNARTHSKKQIEKIANSIKRFGFTVDILIDKNNTILAGHGRLEAAKLLGMTDVPVKILDYLSEEDAKAYVLADNQLALLADWDTDILTDELLSLKENGFDLSLIGFENFKFKLDAEEKDENIPSNIESRAKEGDIWQLGDHRVMCGDSTNPQHVKALLTEAPVLMVTDPPYGVNYDPEWRKGHRLSEKNTSKGTVQNDDRVDWSEAYSLFTGNIAYVWHGAKFTHQVAQHLENCDYELISQIIWVKQHFALSRGDYHGQHEPCWYAVKKGQNHNWQDARDQSTTWQIQNNNSFGGQKEKTWGHGTQKPLDCMLKPILNNTAEGESVYDPFGGSGTTLIAAEKSKRRCFMMELDTKYVDVILARWEEFTGKKAKLI